MDLFHVSSTSMNRNLLIITISLILSFQLFAQQKVCKYWGTTKSILVIANMTDSLAVIEYYFTDIFGNSQVKFDTLHHTEENFKGKFSQISMENNELLFKPGKIKLVQGTPDESSNQKRNLSYLNYKKRQFEKSMQWNGEVAQSFNAKKWVDSLDNFGPDTFKKFADLAFDSLKCFYTSIFYCSKFSSIEIRDNSLFHKVIYKSTDSAEIFKFWNLFQGSYPVKRNLTAYYIQLPLYAFIIAVLTPFEYPPVFGGLAAYITLVSTEKLVIDRLNNKSNFTVLFYEKSPQTPKCLKLKIRNSKIITDKYKYILPVRFESVIRLKD
jgi:hypothetical protein